MLDELIAPELWRALSLVLMNLALAGLAGGALLQWRLPEGLLRPFRLNALKILFAGLGLNLLSTTMVFADVGVAGALPLLGKVIRETQSGHLMALELAGSLLMAFALRHGTAVSSGRVAGLTGFALCVWARAATGHAGTEGLLNMQVAVHALHIAAACGWAGLLLAWLWLGPASAEEQTPGFRRHLSESALLCLLTVLFTGLADTLRMVNQHGPARFMLSAYAGLLATKALLVLAAAGLGGMNRYLVMPLIDQHPEATGRFYGVALAEGCLLLMVLMLAAQLANTMPG